MRTLFSAPSPTSLKSVTPESRPVRVAFVVTRSDSVGGASVHVRDFSRVLLDAGHDARVFIGGEGPVTDALRALGVPYHSLRHFVREVNPREDILGFCELRAALRAFRPEIVSTHTSKAGALGRVAAWSLGVPAVYTPHCWSFADGFKGASFYRWAERIARPFGKKIIMVSEQERQEGLAAHIGPPAHLVTIHNGMPDIPGRLRADPRGTPPKLVMVGRCEAQKDHLTLFRALAQVKDLPWTLDCIGDGPLRPQLEAEREKLGLTGRIQLLGYRKDVAEHMARAQIFALITHWEGFPRSIIEAMRAGLPVIASAVGGNAESVMEGKTGFIVARNDAGALAGRLRSLLADPDLRGRFGAAGRRRYEEHFTLTHMVEKTRRVWSELLGRPLTIATGAIVTPSQPIALIRHPMDGTDASIPSAENVEPGRTVPRDDPAAERFSSHAPVR